ncbi:RloB family protein [Endozoicomonas sp. 4G]|uniref:RloB family protein n=1 Tax=Endozoicomonas sp. 4G TaxID=2872754 RepID=UPI0020791524|nr:RloB family protein [Endozoicomonas sp. 4G]
MGSEDLFHKRKVRKLADSERKKAKRQPYDKVLIVCEGQKTEPIYFEEIRLFHELDSANIEIDGACDSSPMSVVSHAYSLYIKELSLGDSYNRVFCVFDRDRHSTFHEAVQRVEAINQELVEKGFSDQVNFKAITSNPSFEYWFLLHYNPTTKPYAPVQGKSVGDQVIDDLRQFIPDYKKTQKGLYQKSINEGTLSLAIAHSKRIFESANRSNDADSCTNIHELVLYLRDMKGA